MTGPKIFVKACINGARTPDRTRTCRSRPEQLAAEAVAAHNAGAQAVHLHPKTADGVDSLLPDAVDAAVAAVRRAAPGLPLGVTTGFWALPDAGERLVGGPALDGAARLRVAELARTRFARAGRGAAEQGLGVEVGIFHAEAAAVVGAVRHRQHCMRVMIELRPDADTGIADDLLDRVRAANSPAPVLLHGLDESCWPLLEHAGHAGVQTRIGMEDTLRLPDGSTAPGNAAWWRPRYGC